MRPRPQEPLITADTALCEWHRLHCPPSAQLDALCLAADDRERAFRRELEALGDLGKVPQGAIPCEDYQARVLGITCMYVYFMCMRRLHGWVNTDLSSRGE